MRLRLAALAAAGTVIAGWGTPVATASARVWENDCNPDCTDGTTKRTPGSVTVQDLQDGVYQEITINATGMPYDGVTQTLR